MECFYHPSIAAVGTCKNCHRGICRECLAEVTDGIACKERCERQATAIGKLWKQSDGAFAIYAVFLLAMGAIFIGIEVVNAIRYGAESVVLMPIAMGGVFAAVGIIFAWKAYRSRRAEP